MRRPVTSAAITRALRLGIAAAVLVFLGAAGAGCARSQERRRPVTLYVVNYDDGTVTPVNTATGKADKPIALMEPGQHDGATEVAITPDGKTAYVPNSGDELNAVTPINTATNTAGKAIPVGPDPGPVVITPNGKTAYVLSDGVIPINTVTNKAGPPIRGTSWGTTMVLSQNGAAADVLRTGILNTVTPINTVTNTAGPPIPVSSGAWAIAVTPNGKTVYVANWNLDTVIPVDNVTGTTGKPIRVGHQPEQIVITPNGKTAYVADADAYTANADSGAVTPIDTATNKPCTAIKVSDISTLAITPDGKTLYVLGPDTMTPVSTATGRPGKPIMVGGGNIAFTANGQTAWVVNSDTDTVTPVSTVTGRVGQGVVVGNRPFGIAITP